MRWLLLVLIATLLGCGARAAVPSPASAPSAVAHGGHFIAPTAGTPLMFCRSPGLGVTIKLDSASVGLTHFAMGTARIAPGAMNAGVHEGQDEIVYFLAGDGVTFIANDTTRIMQGLVSYIPRGTRHGFISTGSSPIEFLWVVLPGDLASRFRTNGIAPGSSCPAPVEERADSAQPNEKAGT